MQSWASIKLSFSKPSQSVMGNHKISLYSPSGLFLQAALDHPLKTKEKLVNAAKTSLKSILMERFHFLCGDTGEAVLHPGLLKVPCNGTSGTWPCVNFPRHKKLSPPRFSPRNSTRGSNKLLMCRTRNIAQTVLQQLETDLIKSGGDKLQLGFYFYGPPL